MQSRSIGLTAALVIALCPYVEPPEAPAQSKDAKQATGSISGVVTSDGRPAPDVLVLFVKGPTGDLEAPTVGRTRSDKEGRFVFRGLERGSYGVDAYSPGMFVIDQSSEEGAVAVSVTDGEEVKNVEISLVKGCTITGKLIDEHGNLIASQRICVFAKLPSGKFDPVKTWETRVASDDRGVYRVFGLPPGAYAVGAGRVPAEGVERMSPALWHAFDRRFHGGSSTPDDARLVEIANGAEAQGIDIVLKRAADGYRIRGRVINSETDQPFPNVFVHIGEWPDGPFDGSELDTYAPENGEFVLKYALAGTYGITASLRHGDERTLVCEPIEVRVVDRDVNDVVIRMAPAATVNGVIALDATGAGLDLSTIDGLYISLVAITDPAVPPLDWNALALGSLHVRPDGTFTLARVRPGSYLAIVRSDGAEHFYLVRTEKDGAQLSGLLRVNKGETVGNVRIVIGRTLGVVRVRVAVRGGRVDLSLVEVVVEVVGSGAPLLGGYCDSSGTLQITGVPPGDIRVRAETPDFESKRYVRSKAVRIALPLDGTVDVTLELDPAANPTGEGDEQ